VKSFIRLAQDQNGQRRFMVSLFTSATILATWSNVI
jgi:hypothetical protein